MWVSWRHILAAIVVGLVAALTLATTALAWRLKKGPIPLAFLDPRVEATLSGLLPGVTAHVEHTELGWAGHLPELRVTGVTLVHGERPVASFPSLGILPSLRALARGRFAVHRVSLSGIRVALVRDAEGRLRLGTDRSAVGGGEAIDLSALLAFGGNDDSATRFLRRIRIRDATVSLDDRSAGALWSADDADVHIKFVAHGFSVELAGALSVASPTSGVIRGLLLPVVATAKLARREGDGVASVAFEANAKNGRVVPAGSAGTPLPLRSLIAKGEFSPLSRAINLRELHAAIGSAEIDSAATVSIDDPRAGLVLHGELRSLPIAELDRLWPPEAATSTREWIERNIRDGTVSRCLFTLRLPDARSKGLDAKAVDVRFDFQGLTVDYLRDLTPLTDVRGSGTLDAERFRGRVTEGKVGGLEVEGGSVEIRFGGGPAHLTANADVSGPSQSALTILDQPPLGIPERIGIPAGGLGGTSRTHVEVEMPLKVGLLSRDVKVIAKSELHDASLRNLLAGVGIEGGDLTVRVEDGNVNVEGESALTGLPMQAARAHVAVAYLPSTNGSGDRLDVAIEGTDLLAKAFATFDGKTIRTLSVARIRFGGNDLTAELTRREGGDYRLSIDGASADLEPFLRERGPVERLAGTVRAAYDVDFRVGRVNIGRGVDLSGVQGVARHEDGRLVAFNGTGNVANAGRLGVNLAPQGPIKRLEISSDRAGELLKAVGMFQSAEGGQLALVATVDDRSEETRVDGRLDLKDVRVTQAPIVARVLSLGSLDGIASLLGGQGILISRAQIPLTWSRERLDVREATAVGAIGVTVDGSVDRVKRTIDLRGSIFPAYTLNSALGKIPFIGELLVGEKGGGVFGIAYRVSGDLDNPNVEANPLSALAPGMLRRMFVDPFKHEESPPKDHQ